VRPSRSFLEVSVLSKSHSLRSWSSHEQRERSVHRDLLHRHVSATDVGAAKAPDSQEPVMQAITTIGLDIAKSVFQVHGVDAEGKVVIRR
jgi:hypothetical protein